MSCRICIELEQFLHAAQVPDAPEALLGLNERGLTNLRLQREERIAMQQLAQDRHRKVCLEPEPE
jgi:hypothetical protein